MERPKVSVSLITYNHERYIAACLDSVINQHVDFDYEIIVADDCSSDHTAEIVQAYALKYPNLIKPILRKANLGLVRNAISTIEACSGEYIALMEGDDFWIYNNKLQIQADYLDNNADCAFCFTNNYTFLDELPDKMNLFFTNENKPPNKFDLDFFIGHNTIIPNNTKMFRREVQPASFPDWYYTCLNWDWVLHIMQSLQGKMGYIDIATLAYRRHSEAVFMSKDKIKILSNSINTAKGINEYLGLKYSKRFGNLWWEYRELAFAYLEKKEPLFFLKYYFRYLGSIKKVNQFKLKDDFWQLRKNLLSTS